jgi:hypothetical protein
MPAAPKPMKSAPRDGTVVLIKARGLGWVRAYYMDCAWLRTGKEKIPDCWRRPGYEGDDVELRDALGWRPSANPDRM